jgi:vacuolar-type H+-ATPase subunit I/STV1
MDHQNCPDAKVVEEELLQFQSSVPDAIRQITDLIKLKKQLDDQEKKLKATLTNAMERHGVKSFENDLIKMTYVAPTTRSTIDSTRLKKDHPALAEQYTKVSDVSASVRVSLKGGGQ